MCRWLFIEVQNEVDYDNNEQRQQTSCGARHNKPRPRAAT